MTGRLKFSAAVYLRLSRDDTAVRGTTGSISKTESDSIGSQRELILRFLQKQEEIELYDIYVDDGYSGSNFDRPEFKRMIRDIETGRVNCVIVKDLSRFGRDYIETGRYLERIFPVFGVRFIALTDGYDSFLADAGERQIVLPVKNFINDSYCRDISVKVKSQLEIKRKAGECLAPFAVYGYRKSSENKNKLVADAYAAEIVRRIYAWKIEGMGAYAIAKKLNELCILSPREYKKSMGQNYRGGFLGEGWSSSTVKRILTDEVYLGHLLQGKTEKINYKLKKSVSKPKEEWIRAENTHEAIVSADDFEIVRNLLRTDGRVSSADQRPGPFTGLLFCGDCGEQMIRRRIRYKKSEKIYYICSTKNRGEGCSRHSMEETVLKELVEFTVCSYVNALFAQEKVSERVRKQKVDLRTAEEYRKELVRLRRERDKYERLCEGLNDDLRQGIITKDEWERLLSGFRKKSERFSAACREQTKLLRGALRAAKICEEQLAAFQNSLKMEKPDRHTLASLVKEIRVYENRRVEIEFYFCEHTP